MMVEHMDGKQTGAHFLESLLAEATIPLLDLPALAQSPRNRPSADQADQPNQPDVTAQMEAEHAAYRAQMQRLQHQQAEAELQSRPAVPTDPNPGEAPDADDLPTGLQALDARIRHYSAELASRDLFFGRIAQRFLALRGWQTLGFTTEAHYARERLGMSRASLRSKLSLARRSQALHQVADALQQGQIGFEAAHLIARIATPTTERAWLTRATRRTFKHLREEVQAVEMATRFLGETDTSPPTEAQLQQVEAAERAILSGDLLRRVIRAHPSEHDGRAGKLEAGAPEPHAAVQISVTPETDEPTPVQISVPPETSNQQPSPDIRNPRRQSNPPHPSPRRRPPPLPPTRTPPPSKTPERKLHPVPLRHLLANLGPHPRRLRQMGTDLPPRSLPLHQPRLPPTQRHPPPRKIPSQRRHRRPRQPHHPLPLLPPRRRTRRPPKNPPPGNNPTWLLGRHPIIKVHRRERTLLA